MTRFPCYSVGIFAYSGRGPAELSECTDGTTQTAAVSEWLLGVGSDTNRDPHRVVFETSESLPRGRSVSH